MVKEFLGETIGTFIIVFIGCGTVALEVLYGTFGHLIPIALMWGAGVALAIFSSRKLSPAHLNPAVTIAMYFNKDLEFKKILPFIVAQFYGAFMAAFCLLKIFNTEIVSFENVKSIQTAKMFGEYYVVDTFSAFALEAVGTTFLVLMIFIIVSKIKSQNLTPILIGLVVSIAIVFIAPYTQCGINPARDFAPRLVSYYSGWGNVAFSQSSINVYVLAPFVGGIIGWLLFKVIKKPLLIK